MTRVTDQLKDTPVWTVLAAMARLARAQHVAESRSRLKVADRRLMWLLSDGVPRTMREVAEESGIDQSTVSRQVGAALSAGLIERQNPPGQQAGVLSPTGDGAQRFEADLSHHVGLYQRALAALPADQVEEFVAALELFTAAYAEAADEA
ncbi:MAG: MarR family winged helix-turn-helix transcriptional regulator [Aeromicrobium sp.]|uniref:MarR family winged helix-turn-helix transcriptional regulator n=1 Tax=Aeromicrobium sp. TaxID=1871063 RepID=UPI0039E479A1